jgi:hypothetical protein
MNTNIQPVTFRQFLPICLLFILICTALPSYAAKPMPREYQLKAVFLEGFTKFVAWPDNTFAKPNTLLRICVLGEHPFGNALDIAVANTNKRKRKGRHREVQYLNGIKHVAGCHVLYVSRSDRYRRAAVLDYVLPYPLLTVSDMEGFVINGGMIQLYTRRNKVRFFIDPQTIRDTGLEPHGNLLRIADIVSSGR